MTENDNRPMTQVRRFFQKARNTISPRVHREHLDANPPFAFVDSMPPLLTGAPRISDLIRLFLLDLRTIITIPIKITIALLKILGTLLSLIYPLIFWLFIVWIFWYGSHIFWPYLIQVVLLVFIPIANVLIILFNFFFMLFLIILRILIIVWNIVVPFLGMILYVVINVVLTILAEVFNVIGAIDWEPIISAIMKILLVLVDIAMQILLVFIKVGMEVLQAVAKIISFVVEVFMVYVKIWLEVITWVFKLLFTILEPILKIVGIFFGAISSMFGARMSMASGRKLLSLSLSVALLNTTNIDEDRSATKPLFGEGADEQLLQEYEKFIEETLNIDQRRDDFLKTVYDKAKRFKDDTDHHFLEEIPDLFVPEPPTSQSSFSSFASSSAARRLLQLWKQPSTSGLRFIDDAPLDDDGDDSTSGDGKDSYSAPNLNKDSGLDDYAHTMAHTLYTGSRNMPKDDVDLAHQTMARIMEVHRNKDRLGMRSLLQEYANQHGHLSTDFGETLASVNINDDPEHPRDMHVRLYQERQQKIQQFTNSNTGRKLMGQGDGQSWSTAQKNYMSALEVEHARAILEQQKEYKKFHTDRMVVATVVYGATTKALKTTVENGFNPENIIKHWDETLRQFGYQDIWHIREEFLSTHGDAAAFIESFSFISEHPFFKYFKERDDTRPDSPYFHDWAVEQRKQEELRRSYRDAQRTGGRSLLQVQSNEDSNVAGSDAISKGSGGGFATLSTLNCFSSPKNPMCIPEIPWSFTFSIPTIKLTDKQKRTIQEDVEFCTPWKYTWCVICLDRFVNVWQEFRFLLSTIPLINYPIATLTILAPWLSWMFNWIFLVPKFHVGTVFQVVCFIYHLYDVFIVTVFLYLAKVILWPIALIIWDTIQNIQVAKLPEGPTPSDLRDQAKMERIWATVKEREQIQARIGAAHTEFHNSGHYDDDSSCSDSDDDVDMRLRRRRGYRREQSRRRIRSRDELRNHRVRREIESLRDMHRRMHGNTNDPGIIQRQTFELLRIINEREFQLDTENIDEDLADQVADHLGTHAFHAYIEPPSSMISGSSSSSQFSSLPGSSSSPIPGSSSSTIMEFTPTH